MDLNPTKKEWQTLKEATAVFGEDVAIDKIIEEMGELTVELLHYRYNRNKVERVLEESADVLVVLCQIIQMFGYGKVMPLAEIKLKRLRRRVDRKDKTAK